MMWYWYLFTFAVGVFIGWILFAAGGGGSRADYDSEVLRLEDILRINGIDPGPGFLDN